MALPTEFSPWEHLQSTFQWVHNRLVREEFKDLAEELDINTPRQSLRTACLMNDDDSALMTLVRFWLFYVVIGQASKFHPEMYAIPTDTYQQEVKFLPQVVLYFREDKDEVEEGYAPIEARISFRLHDETSESYTEVKAIALANKIKTEFTAANGYRWKKGRVKLSYHHSDAGYNIRINAFTEAEGRAVLDKVLDLQNDAIDLDYLTTSELGSLPPTVPPVKFIYGESRRTPRRRPVGHVRFRWAQLHLWGIPNAITLIDLTGRRSNPLVDAFN